ncbi:hypothetical protein [Sporolituus thermophilus]|uniref:hypothetical protein n=1 Tax=Sporolituus thermophilus TaxID=608505 RepID=UPI000B86D610|nr:hypothetical protein [Sporolituus thermophilus]
MRIDEIFQEKISESERMQAQKSLCRALDEYLSYIEAQIVKMRYGLAGARPATVAEVAEKLGLEPREVKMAELVALQKMGSSQFAEKVREAWKNDEENA